MILCSFHHLMPAQMEMRSYDAGGHTILRKDPMV